MASVNLGKRTEAAKELIVRHIWRSHLREGDQMPSTAQLRRELGVGNVTISRAMQSLQADGVVEIRDKVGVFVRHAEADGYAGWRVGVICTRMECNPFVALLVNSLQLSLHDSGCETIPFFRNSWSEAGVYHFDRLDDFRALRRHIERGLLHGVITTAGLAREAWEAMEVAGLEPCMVGVPNLDAPRGVFLDYPHMVRRGIEELRRRGCRRISLCLCRHPEIPEVEQLLRDELAPGWGVGRSDRCYCDVRTVVDAERFGRGWAEAAAEDLPDGLLIPDDLLCNWLLPEVAARPDWRPQIIGAGNRELPLRFSLPVIGQFNISIMELAARVCAMVTDRFENKETKNEIQWYRPEFQSRQ